ncbi:hypothetical protein A5698_20900 [Mycobacterium sp. E136]|uniref:hypothetical protein n=1 Tax=Mycobacterium sp. E136 TaxID=1834125 RepID=UPI0007FD1E02|nr:hypothetical protein [Mycobacterium sp. E136]OBG91453.1 hypothetical protein A5698_20900 [Mycobacterium sp. E136]
MDAILSAGLVAVLMFTLRFDIRAPAEGAPTTELYSVAVQMCGRRQGDESVASISSAPHW